MDLRKQILQNAPNPVYKPGCAGTKKDRYEPTVWNEYYDEREITESGLCVYKAGSKGPFVLLLHGAGHTALTWALVAVSDLIFPSDSTEILKSELQSYQLRFSRPRYEYL